MTIAFTALLTFVLTNVAWVVYILKLGSRTAAALERRFPPSLPKSPDFTHVKRIDAEWRI